MTSPNPSSATEAPKSRKLMLSLSEDRERDLARRAGALQVEIGENISLQEYIYRLLWPTGEPA